MKRYQINFPLFILAQLGWWTSLFLVYKQLQTGKFCPLLFGLPTCYFMIAIFTLIVIGLFLQNLKQKILIYIPALLGFVTASWFSWLQMTETTPGIIHCPQFFGWPLCYASFIIFGLIIFFQYWSNRK